MTANREGELWALLLEVETDTLARYGHFAPELGSAAKSEAVAAMRAYPELGALSETGLELPVRQLLDAAAGDGSRADVALLQGLVLERLGATIYESLRNSATVSTTSAELAGRAQEASSATCDRAVVVLREVYPDPQVRFDAFAHRSRALFGRLDALGEALDDRFSEPLGLQFADVMGDFVADLLPCCVDDLGFQRRRVMVHLTGALMG